MMLKGINAIGNDSFFIRLKDQPTFFIHPIGFDKDGNALYQAKSGNVGAAMFHKKNATSFVAMSGKDNLEIVKVSDILKPDGSGN